MSSSKLRFFKPTYYTRTVVLLRYELSYVGDATIAAKVVVREPSNSVSTVCVKSNVTDSTTPTLI